MTKAKTKAQKRRQRRISLPGGESAPQRPTGADRWHTQQPQEAADALALSVRARLTGCTAEAARDVLAGEDMGRCIIAMRASPEDRRALLTVWQGISAAWANFCNRVLSTAPTPQAAALPMLPDPMQTDPSMRVDIRTPGEKDDAARRVWEEWRAAFNALPVAEALAVAQASRGDGPPLWDADKLAPTRHGALAVKALASLHLARTR